MGDGPPGAGLPEPPPVPLSPSTPKVGPAGWDPPSPVKPILPGRVHRASPEWVWGEQDPTAGTSCSALVPLGSGVTGGDPGRSSNRLRGGGFIPSLERPRPRFSARRLAAMTKRPFIATVAGWKGQTQPAYPCPALSQPVLPYPNNPLPPPTLWTPGMLRGAGPGALRFFVVNCSWFYPCRPHWAAWRGHKTPWNICCVRLELQRFCSD